MVPAADWSCLRNFTVTYTVAESFSNPDLAVKEIVCVNPQYLGF